MKSIAAHRPYVMTIAGFDPTAGAGLLADIKCFEQLDVYGFGICTALTIQTDIDFLKNDWLSAEQIIDQMAPLLSRFQVSAVKIGLIEDISIILQVITYLKKHLPDIRIVMDPVLKASAGYRFHDWEDGLKQLQPILTQIDLITPNYPEMMSLGGKQEVFTAAKAWAVYVPVLLKGGHLETHTGTDYLFAQGEVHVLTPSGTPIYQKHGSGCVLSSAITAQLAKGFSLAEACILAKRYVEQFLNSNQSLLGHHKL
jgi:hydroxymethylpyrimidine/phosphomethylpyrimidine kinase